MASDVAGVLRCCWNAARWFACSICTLSTNLIEINKDSTINEPVGRYQCEDSVSEPGE